MFDFILKIKIRIAEKKLKRIIKKRNLKTDLHLINEDIIKAHDEINILNDIKKDQDAKIEDDLERLDPSIFSKCISCHNVYLKNDKHVCY